MIEGIDTSGIRIPLWFLDCELPSFPQLNENITTDVCIIGGGITGLTAAYLLCMEGKKVAVLDDGNIVSGETGRTSGHLCNAVDDHYFELEKVYGKQGAKYVAESHSAAVDLIEKIIKTESIECDFKRVNGYLFLCPEDKLSTLEKERDAATRAGLKVELLLDGNINQFKLGPVLKFYNQAKFHPLKYLAGLSQAILKKSGNIFTLTHASDIKPGKVVEVKTTNGFAVKANNVIIATNAPVFDKAMLFSKQKANRTYVIGVSVQNNNLEDALFWDTGDPYHYLRFHTINGMEKDFILSVGGEDHKTGVKIDKETIFKKLEHWTKKTIPQFGEIKYYWSGQILEPADHLAFIGLDPTEEKNIYVATGDSGNGLTHGTIAGILLTDQIAGRTNPWWEIYNPSRKQTKNLGAFFKQNIAAVSKLIKYFTGGELSNVEKIKTDEGAVIRKGFRKLAVYRDPEGKLHYCSAICPHMKGIISWNKLEKSWDCPLHGSRFTPFGEVMNGPAISDLEKEKN